MCVESKFIKVLGLRAIESRENIIPSALGKFVWCVAWVLEFKVVDSMVEDSDPYIRRLRPQSLHLGARFSDARTRSKIMTPTSLVCFD